MKYNKCRYDIKSVQHISPYMKYLPPTGVAWIGLVRMGNWRITIIMDIHGKRYILLQNLVGHLQERSILSFGAIKSTPTQLLKGELLEALPDTEQPDDSTRIALAGIDRKNVRLECRTLDITRLTNEDNNLLLAISSVGLRYETFVDRKRLDFGRQISPGSIVLVEVKGITRKVFGVVWYIGELPPYRGTMFGVELQVSMFWCYSRGASLLFCRARIAR